MFCEICVVKENIFISHKIHASLLTALSVEEMYPYLIPFKFILVIIASLHYKHSFMLLVKNKS